MNIFMENDKVISLTNLFQHLLTAEIYLNEKLNLYFTYPNQCKEQTNSNLFPIASSRIWWFSLSEK